MNNHNSFTSLNFKNILGNALHTIKIAINIVEEAPDTALAPPCINKDIPNYGARILAAANNECSIPSKVPRYDWQTLDVFSLVEVVDNTY